MKKAARFLSLVLCIAALLSLSSAFADRKLNPDDVILGYNMVFYCTKRDAPPNSLMFRDYSIKDSLFPYGASKTYGEKHLTRYVDAAQFVRSTEFPPDGSFVTITYDDQTRAGYQMGDTTAYNFGDDNYFWFVESVVTGSSPVQGKDNYIPIPTPTPKHQEQVVGYNMVHYGTQSAQYPYNRMFRDYSILGKLEYYGARESYGEKHLTKYVTVDQMACATTYPANNKLISVEYNGEVRAGYQFGDTTAYNFGDDNYIWYIESVVVR